MDKVTWHILGDQITQTSTLKKGGGGITDVFEVPYEIDSGPAKGHTGSVTILANAFNQQTVKDAIDQQAGAVHAVASITS